MTASGRQITGCHPELLLFWFVAFADSH
jgi:hypothetical protein